MLNRAASEIPPYLVHRCLLSYMSALTLSSTGMSILLHSAHSRELVVETTALLLLSFRTHLLSEDKLNDNK